MIEAGNGNPRALLLFVLTREVDKAVCVCPSLILSRTVYLIRMQQGACGCHPKITSRGVWLYDRRKQ